MRTNKIEEVADLSKRLAAIGNWQMDQVCMQTATSKLLLDSAKWLEKLSHWMCGAGMIGCDGGPDCDSDHK